MRFRRAENDMFGRPAAPLPAPVKQPRVSPRQRPIPPGLAPFISVIALVVVLVAFLITPVLGVAVLVVFIAAIVRMRYKDIKRLDYLTIRRSDPIYRSLEDFRHGHNRYGDSDRPPE